MTRGAGASDPVRAPPPLALTVSALGVAQIVSWGSLFYSISVLAAPIRADLDVSDVVLFGAFTGGLIASGLPAPWIGRRIDALGGRAVLAGGSLVAATAMGVLALAQGPASLVIGWLLAGIAMAATLYDPAFATLSVIAGASYRRAVTALTLFGGFASTVFWPLSQLLQQLVGWRGAFGVYALLHLAVCVPLIVTFVPHGGIAAAPRASIAAPVAATRSRAFVLLATALALVSLLSTGIAAHLIGLFTAKGLTAGEAVAVGAMIGPMQVTGRVVEFAFARRFAPLAVGTFAFVLLAASLVVLVLQNGTLAAGFAFAVLYGASIGVLTIVRGVVPAELFGRDGYGALLGRLAMPQQVARAIAPLAFAAFFAVDAERTRSPWLLCACGVAALAAYEIAIRRKSVGSDGKGKRAGPEIKRFGSDPPN